MRFETGKVIYPRKEAAALASVKVTSRVTSAREQRKTTEKSYLGLDCITPVLLLVLHI